MVEKTAKAERVTILRARFVDAKGIIISDYCGLNVQQMAELRSRLRRATAVELHVIKNTLARRAVEETHFVSLADHFVGPTSVALADNDDGVVSMAKILTEYARSEPKLNIRIGLVEGQLLSPEQLIALAELPPREVLLGRMLGSMQSPVAGLVRVFSSMLRQLLYALVAVKEEKEKASL